MGFDIKRARICEVSLVVNSRTGIGRTPKILSTVVFLILVSSCFAQEHEPLQAPDDVVLQFDTERGIHEFHLGELIPVRYSFSAKTIGRYVRVEQSRKLEGGGPLEISCVPQGEAKVSPPLSSDSVRFHKMLTEPCGSAGFEGGVSGGCVECNGANPLTGTPLSFEVPLNMYVHFRTAGIYTCQASSAEIASALPDGTIEAALMVKSKPIILTIVDDPAWARSAAIAYGDEYRKACGGDVIAEQHFLRCSDLAQRIIYLDTPDSLKIEVKMLDGVQRGWDNGFWEAIQHSSQPENALQLMESRFQEPDFQVSSGTIEWLAIADIKQISPNSFEGGALEEYHEQAVASLRKYVRLLGSSLARKNSTVLLESLKTYWAYTEQRYCDGDTLIPEEERNDALRFLQ